MAARKTAPKKSNSEIKFTAHAWKKGEAITAERLNEIEQAVAAVVSKINQDAAK